MGNIDSDFSPLVVFVAPDCVIIYKTIRDQAKQNPILDRGIGHQGPPLTEELLATDGCLERESHFILRVWPLVG